MLSQLTSTCRSETEGYVRYLGKMACGVDVGEGVGVGVGVGVGE